jgi:DNA-binding transcriptional LysR family regulator
MELRQLEYLVAVADEASFTRAAARLHVAQPGVSAQVRRLERELGQQLLERSGGVRPTAVGAAVLPHARAALAAVAGVLHTVEDHAGLVQGRVAMGVVTSYTQPDVPTLLGDFREAHPGVEIALTEANTDVLVAGLRDGTLDLALVSLPAADVDGLDTRIVTEDVLVAAVSHGHPLAGRASIPVRALRDLSLISLPRGTGLRRLLDDACASAGFQPRIALEAGDPGVLARLAVRGLGVAIVPASLAAGYADALDAVPIVRPELRGALALAWRAGGAASPAGRALVAHALR